MPEVQSGAVCLQWGNPGVPILSKTGMS